MSDSPVSVFRRAEHEKGHHENPVSRAALLIMRLVPLAYECFLDLACEGPGAPPAGRFTVARLPKGEFFVQRRPSPDDKARQLLSVFLAPEARKPEAADPVDVKTPRNAIHDGFIRHREELIVVIEAKRFDQADYEQARCPGQMTIEDPGAVRFVSWTELVDRWLGLVENGLLSHAEAEMIEDFVELLAENEQINPFSRLSRCRGRETPIALRLRDLLAGATGLPADHRWASWESGGEISGLTGSASMLILSRYPNDDAIRLGMWAAITQPQKNLFYSNSERLERLAAAVHEPPAKNWTWNVEWKFELKPPRFENPTVLLASEEMEIRPRLLQTRELSSQLNTVFPEAELEHRLREFVEVGLTTRERAERAVSVAASSGYDEWRLIAAVYVWCAWELSLATELDDPDARGGNPMEMEIRDACDRLTALVGAKLP